MKCMVIDGNSIINRAYYGIRPLTNREGLYTHAVFGFLTTLLRLKEEERPDALCVTFDLHAPTFRHKADEAYKATRKPMPEELRMQVPVLKEVLDTLNIPVSYTHLGADRRESYRRVRLCGAGRDLCAPPGLAEYDGGVGRLVGRSHGPGRSCL